MTRRVALFAAHPMPGAVKTRLTPSLPPRLACDLYRAMLLDALAAMAASGATERLLYWLGADEGTDSVAAPNLTIRVQRGADLGERLRNGFGDLLAVSGDRAVAIGGDCPELDGAAVRRAFDALDECDVVIGPAQDGGYYLIGLRTPAPDLFTDMPWGTSSVLEDTMRRTQAAGLSVTLLAPLSDFDTPQDLVGFLARAAEAPATVAPNTRAALRAMGFLPGFA